MKIHRSWSFLHIFISIVAQRYGSFVERWRLPFLVCPVLLTILASFFLKKSSVAEIDSFALFDDEASPSTRELRNRREHLRNFAHGGDSLVLEILVTKPDGSSILDPDILHKALQIYDTLRYGINATDALGFHTIDDLCTAESCLFGDQLLRPFVQLFLSSRFEIRHSPNIRLTFPVMRFFETTFEMQQVLGSVTLSSGRVLQQAKVLKINVLVSLSSTIISEAEEIELRRKRVINLFRSIERFILELPSSATSLSFHPFHHGVLINAVDGLVDAVLPKLLICFLALLAVVLLEAPTEKLHFTSHLPVIAGLISPVLALVTALAFLNWLNIPWNAMLCATPFLVLTIGVDDLFFFLSAWNNNSTTSSSRLQSSISSAGLSVATSSFINILSFAVGTTQTIMAVRQFCFFTSIALLMEFLFQMTFFVAVLAYVEQWTDSNDNCDDVAMSDRTKPNRENAVNNCLQAIASSWLRVPIALNRCCFYSRCSKAVTRIKKLQLLVFLTTAPTAQTVTNDCSTGPVKSQVAPIASATTAKPTMIFMVIGFAVYLFISLYGCAITQRRFSASEFALSDSTFARYLSVRELQLRNDPRKCTVIINNPPNLADSVEVSLFYRMVRDLGQNSPKWCGPASTELWLNSFLDWKSHATISNDKSAVVDNGELLRRWLQLRDVKRQWKNWFLVVDETNGTEIIRAFHFNMFFENLSSSTDEAALLAHLRDTTRNYSKFNASIYLEGSESSDALLSIADYICQDAGVTILLICFICVFLLPQPICLFWVCYFTLTAELGVVGFCKLLFDVDLSPPTMITIPMGVGLSVDCLLHVAHCLSSNAGAGSQTEANYYWLDKRHVIRPILQGSLATVIGVSGLCFVNARVLKTFFFTIVTVVVIGNAHCLLFLPMVLIK